MVKRFVVLFLSFLVFFSCASKGAVQEEAPYAAEKAPEPVPTEPVPAQVPAPVTTAPKPPPAPKPAPSPKPAPASHSALVLTGARIHTVRYGDTLAKVSRRYYGKSIYFPLIAMASGIPAEEIDLIIPPERLTIPNLLNNRRSPGAREAIKKYFLDTAEALKKRRPSDSRLIRRAANDW